MNSRHEWLDEWRGQFETPRGDLVGSVKKLLDEVDGMDSMDGMENMDRGRD